MSKKIAIVYSPEEPKPLEQEFTIVRSPSSPTARIVTKTSSKTCYW
jgi:hypothetical protein